MPPSSSIASGFSGWPRTLPLQLAPHFDGPAALEQVGRAIELERRAVNERVELRVEEVQPLHPEQGLWRLQVRLPPGRKRLQQWEGAILWRELLADGCSWRGEVIEAEARGRWLLVDVGPDDPPEPGLAWARPFDFLRAPDTLLRSPRLSGVLPAYGQLLGAALGATAAPDGVRQGWAGPAAWNHGWAMVWGPPGTGKTHTLVAEVRRLLRHPDERVLVVSTTNRATDEVAMRLGPQPGGVLRLGAVDVARFRAEGRLDVLPRPEARLDHIEAAQHRVEQAKGPARRASALRALALARQGMPRLAQVLADQGPRCVVTTAHSALSAVVCTEMDTFHFHRRAPFTTVIVDEAGLVPRASAAALALLAARQLVLVGDPRQLSPICIAARSMEPTVKRWLAVSGMEHAGPGRADTQPLLRQHRMHPQISGLVSRFQYGGLLQDAPGMGERDLPEDFGALANWPPAAWLVLERCAGQDGSSVGAERSEDQSWVRPAGIEVFRLLLERYPALVRQNGLFISPYRGQAAAVGAMLTTLGATGWSASTVHAQQGSQADVVVFDPVNHGAWGVLEWKRLVNVALSRARHRLLFLATEAELGQAWLAALSDGLTRCTVAANGALQVDPTTQHQGSLFSPSPKAAPPDRPLPKPAPITGDPASLGVQIQHSRAARRSMTRAQAQLVRRDLKDLGPRLVRGVAGSGKSIVLARWAALELRKWDLGATVVFGNTALEPHLRDLIAQAWRATTADAHGEPPWERVNLVHVGTLLQDLRVEAGLPPLDDPAARFDLERQAQDIVGCGLTARFDLLYIDEAQDLGHETLGLLLSLVKRVPVGAQSTGEHCPVRVFYDNAQNVYRRPTPRWSEYGLDMRGRATVLKESFRATRPAMELALNLLHRLRPIDRDPDMRELIAPRLGAPLLRMGEDGGWHADFCVIPGQAPEVTIHDRLEDELEGLVRSVRSWLADGVQPRDIRVLAPTKMLCDSAADALVIGGIPAVHARNRAFEPRAAQVVVTTPQSFKGYEAELVAVVALDRFCTRAGGGAVLVEVIYVALTRARTWMSVSASRARPGTVGAQVVDALWHAHKLCRGGQD